MPKENTTSTINQLSIQMAKIGGSVERLVVDVADIKKKIEDDYATKEWCMARYDQTAKTVNVILSAFGLAIIAAFAAFVLKGGLQ